MNKKQLVEMGIYKTFKKHHNNCNSRKQLCSKSKGKYDNLLLFSEYLKTLTVRQPLVGEYISQLYQSGKDIMWLYRFYITSKTHDLQKAMGFANRKFFYDDHIESKTLAEHISLNEDLRSESASSED